MLRSFEMVFPMESYMLSKSDFFQFNLTFVFVCGDTILYQVSLALVFALMFNGNLFSLCFS